MNNLFARKARPQNSNSINNNSNNNGNNLNNYADQTKYHQQKVHERFDASCDPINTNVIPNVGFNQNILNNSNNTMIRSQLSGATMKIDDFKHNNMQPFFRGNANQNMDKNINNTLLESFTGNGDVYRKKSEVKSLFDVKKNMTNPNGAPSFNSDEAKTRYVQSQLRTNELPFSQVRVGQGLNQGFTSAPSGGLNQANTRDFATPKDTNDIRTLNNPKLSYEARIITGQKETQRGLAPVPKKQRPARYYKNNPDRYFVTGGSVKAAKLRSHIYKKPTNRTDTKSYYGAPNAHLKKTYKTPAMKKSTNQNYINPWGRNLGQRDKWTPNDKNVGDYGKSGIENKPNERDTTQHKVHKSNLSSLIKALTVPVQDFLKNSRKEMFVGNYRPEGYFGAQMPSKPTTYDPNDIARTTVRETTEDNTHMGNVGAQMPTKPTTYDPNDTARTTTRETTEDNTHIGNMGAQMPSKLTTYDPNDIAKTTMKEQLIHDVRTGNIVLPSKLTVYDPNDVARTTIKETNVHNANPNVNLVFTGPKKLTTYDPNDVPNTTIRETTIDNPNQCGYVQGTNGRNMGYDVTAMEAKNTHKQFLSDYEYYGIADADAGLGGGKGYLVNEYEAKPTHKEVLSDNDYAGIAGPAGGENPMSYAAEYNARVFANREKVAAMREPTKTSAKVANGKDRVTLQHKKIEGDVLNTRNPVETKIYVMPPQKNTCAVTSFKDNLSEISQRERINPEILDALRSNPFSKPIGSVFGDSI